MSKIFVICEYAKNKRCLALNRMCGHRNEHPISEDCFSQSTICFERPKCHENRDLKKNEKLIELVKKKQAEFEKEIEKSLLSGEVSTTDTIYVEMMAIKNKVNKFIDATKQTNVDVDVDKLYLEIVKILIL